MNRNEDLSPSNPELDLPKPFLLLRSSSKRGSDRRASSIEASEDDAEVDAGCGLRGTSFFGCRQLIHTSRRARLVLPHPEHFQFVDAGAAELTSGGRVAGSTAFVIGFLGTNVGHAPTDCFGGGGDDC